MQLELKVYFIDEKNNFYCFKHAIVASQEGIKIITEVEDKEHGAYDMPCCNVCGDFV